jgi:cysteine synthase A
MSLERRQTFQAFGAETVLTPGSRGMMGAVEEAELIFKNNPDYFMPMQFENPANPEIHRKTTAVEIIDALGAEIDGFVAGVGTGGTITGTGEILRSRKSDIWITAVEPAGSPVLSGGEPGPHKIAGIGAGFYPNTSWNIIRRRSMGSPERCKKAWEGQKIAVVFPDRGDRYLSTGLFGA